MGLKDTLLTFKKGGERDPAAGGPGQEGCLINVAGVKGGVGATTVAVNLAILLAGKKKTGAVALVDLNKVFGEIPLFLSIVPNYHWGRILQNINRLDSTFLLNVMAKHSSGLRVLPAPTQLDGNLSAASDLMCHLLKVLKKTFDFVIVDSGQSLEGYAMKALETADLVLLITLLNLPCLHNAKNLLDCLRAAGEIDRGRISLVINRFLKKADITLKEAEETVRMPIKWLIPNDYRTTMSAINRGKPLSEISPRSEAARKLNELANFVLDKECEPKRQGWLKRDGGAATSESQIDDETVPEVVRAFLPEEYFDLKSKIHDQLLGQVDLSLLNKVDPKLLRPELRNAVDRIMLEKRQVLPLNAAEKERLYDEILDEVLGFGPLEPLLKDPTVSDILVNTYQYVYVERFGKVERTDYRFKDDAHLRRIIDKIVSAVGRRIDESSPMVDARMPDGSRVNAVIPPLAIEGPMLSIRRFAVDPLEMEDLIRHKTLTLQVGELLQGIVRSRLNVLISGGTGSGKTTLLNVLSRFISSEDRIITIEDSAELQLKQQHVIRLETRPPNIEGKGEVTQRDLVMNSLRMRPDRIIVGEVRGREAFDMLQAMNTGHHGSLATIHANSPGDALMRLETMLAMANFDIPSEFMRRYISSAIDVVIQLTRLTDGSRKLVSLQEITGMEENTITTQTIFSFDQRGTDKEGKVRGRFMFSGVRPRFIDRFRAAGIKVPPGLFDPEKELEI